MSSAQSSPATASTKDSRKSNLKEFREKITALIAIFDSIESVDNQLVKAGPKSVLRINGPNGTYEIARKDVKNARQQLRKKIKDLPKEFAKAGSRAKSEKRAPESFKGGYAPAFVGPAIQYFLRNGGNGFGYLNPLSADANAPLLADYIAYAKQGYIMKNALTSLFYTYVKESNLSDASNRSMITPDQVMVNAFSSLPAAIYKQVVVKGNPTDKKSKDVFRKYTMSAAVANGLVASPISTFDSVRLTDPQFNPAQVKSMAFQKFVSLNFMSLADLREFASTGQNVYTLDAEGQPIEVGAQDIINNLENVDYRNNLLTEHAYVKQAAEERKERDKPERLERNKARAEQRKREKKANK